MTKSKNKYGKNLKKFKKVKKRLYQAKFSVSCILFIIFILLSSSLYDIMDYISQEGDYKINMEIFIESVQILENFLLYGEREDNQILDIFCEYDFINILKIYTFGTKSKAIISQIIKTLSALIKNISKETVFYYILSNNFINNIISRCFVLVKNDMNFLLIYVNFLEILTTKMDINTVQFLFLEEKGRFPLLDEIIKLYNYPDDNIKKIVKNIIVKIIKIQYKPISKYLCELPSISYFCFLACELKDDIINLSNGLQKTQKDINIDNINNNDKSKILLNNIINNLEHLQNIFEIKCSKINYVIINSMFYYCIIPYILYNLNYTKEERKNKGKKIKKSICILILNLLFFYIKNDTFLNILFILAFYPHRPSIINYYMENIPIQPINYFYDWNQSIKHVSNSFLDFIQFNFNSSYLKSLLYMNKSKYVEVQKIYKKYQEKMINEPNFDIGKNKEEILKEITKDILNELTCSEISIMSSYHSYLSIATGINCGISTKNGDYGIIQKMSIFFQKYKNKEITNDLVQNNIKQNIFQIFQEKKIESNKFLLMNILLNNILNQQKNLSKTLLKELNIYKENLSKNEEENNIINISFSKNNIYNKQSISFAEKENSIIIEDKENLDLNIKNNYQKANYNYPKIINTMISLNGFIQNTKCSLIKPQKKLVNIDNNNDSLEKIENSVDENSAEKNEIKKEYYISGNKYILLNNDYFNNLEKESSGNSINNNNNLKLLDLLLDLIDIKNNRGILSLKIIIDNIFLLVKNQNTISKNQKNKISSIYEKYKNEIIYNYNNKKSFHNYAYQLFIQQYDNYLQIIKFECINIIKNNNIIISKSYEKNFLNDNNININYENKYDILIISFLLIHDFYYKFISYNDNSNNNINKNNTELDIILYKYYFSLLNIHIPLKVNEQYYLINLDPNILYYECKSKIIINKKNSDENFFDSYLLLLDNFLYIGDSSNDSSYTLIKYKFLISSCSIQIDNYNNKNINIYINNTICNNNEIEILLDFKDYNTSQKIIGILEQEIKKAKLFEKDKIKKFIQNLK